jgi:hypothetical protein
MVVQVEVVQLVPEVARPVVDVPDGFRKSGVPAKALTVTG